MPQAAKVHRAHPARTSAEHDRRRGSAASRGYGARWRRYRAWFLSQPINVICGMCQRAVSTLVDHVRAVAGPDDPLFWDPANHLGECADCHRTKSALCDRAMGNAPSAEGAALLRRLLLVAASRAASLNDLQD